MALVAPIHTRLAFHPFLKAVNGFRYPAGYGGVLFNKLPSSAPQGEPPSVEARLAEVQALLNAPKCPLPRSAFEGYCLLFQLIGAVDNKYFGTLNPGSVNPKRLGVPRIGDAFEQKGMPGATAIAFRDHLVIIDGSGRVSFRSGEGGRADDAGRLGAMHRYVSEVSDAVPASSVPKRERLERFIDLLAEAPRPPDDVTGLATVAALLTRLEDRHFAGRDHTAAERLNVPLPFMFYAAEELPGAAVLMAISHAIVYYPDGTVEIFGHCLGRDFGMRPDATVPATLGPRYVRLEGKGASQAAAIAA